MGDLVTTRLFSGRALACVGVSPNGQIMAIGGDPDEATFTSTAYSKIFISTDAGSTFRYRHNTFYRKLLCIQPTNGRTVVRVIGGQRREVVEHDRGVGTGRVRNTSGFTSNPFGDASIIRCNSTSYITYAVNAGGAAFPLSKTIGYEGFSDVYASDSGSKVVFVTFGGKIWINNDANNTNNWVTRGPNNIWTGITGNSDGSILYAFAN